MNIVIADESDVEDIGESSWPIEDWQGIEVRGIDLAKVATLHCLLTGQYFDEAAAEYAPEFAASEEGPWVMRFPDEPKEKLAALEDDALERVGEELAATEEFERDGWPVEKVHDLLAELSDLARVASDQHKTLFIWIGQ